MGFCVSLCLSAFVAKKQKIRYGTNNATKTLRLKGSRRRVFYIFPSVEAWNIDGVNRNNEKATKNGLSFH